MAKGTGPTDLQRLRPGKLSRRGNRLECAILLNMVSEYDMADIEEDAGLFLRCQAPTRQKLINCHAAGSDRTRIYTIECEMMRRNEKSPDLASMHGTASMSDDQGQKSALCVSKNLYASGEILIERPLYESKC